MILETEKGKGKDIAFSLWQINTGNYINCQFGICITWFCERKEIFLLLKDIKRKGMDTEFNHQESRYKLNALRKGRGSPRLRPSYISLISSTHLESYSYVPHVSLSFWMMDPETTCMVSSQIFTNNLKFVCLLIDLYFIHSVLLIQK